jgi:biopolymer transport protein ExbB
VLGVPILRPRIWKVDKDLFDRTVWKIKLRESKGFSTDDQKIAQVVTVHSGPNLPRPIEPLLDANPKLIGVLARPLDNPPPISRAVLDKDAPLSSPKRATPLGVPIVVLWNVENPILETGRSFLPIGKRIFQILRFNHGPKIIKSSLRNSRSIAIVNFNFLNVREFFMRKLLFLSCLPLAFATAHADDKLAPASPQQVIETTDPFEDDDLFSADISENEIFSKVAEAEDKPAPQEKAVAKAPAPAPAKPVAAKKAAAAKSQPVEISAAHVFAGSPTIYTLLFFLSLSAVALWLYLQMNLAKSTKLPDGLTSNLRNALSSNQFDQALSLCKQQQHLFCKMISTGIATRTHGFETMTDAMKSEGRRLTTGYWQKIALLNDIAIIAPMIGLLGTVLGMFYAFYDLNRSVDSVSNLFDGLGISVGTTVAGLGVAILAMILHSTMKYRLSRQLVAVENEAHTFATLIDSKTSIRGGV